jgi:hypothetical protein
MIDGAGRALIPRPSFAMHGGWWWKEGILHVLLETCLHLSSDKVSAENVANLGWCLFMKVHFTAYLFALRAHAGMPIATNDEKRS